MWAVSKSTVRSVLDAVAPRVRLINTRASLVVTKMVATLSVSSRSMEVGTPGKAVTMAAHDPYTMR